MYLTSARTVVGLLAFAGSTFAHLNATDEVISYASHLSHDRQPLAELSNGTVLGVHSATYDQDFFLGVPFAQAPINGLRFRNPQSLNTTFSPDGFQATIYAPSCIGYGAGQSDLPMSEDCLYLNIVRPSGYDNVSLPVAVWIHGGGFTTGASRLPGYNLSFIVENSVRIGKPIIGISIAYRLAGWGFLASQQVSGHGDTNMALRDQRLALHWIQENIAAFGGDHAKVTIWGESAGAASVGFQLTAYNGRDDKLFWAAIMESCNPVFYFSFETESYYQSAYDQLVSAMNCSAAIDSLECLRQAPFEPINDFFNSSAGANWQPIVDGDLIARWASQQLKDGAFVHVPIIDGANSDEGTSFSPKGVNTEADFAFDVTRIGESPGEDTGYAGDSPSIPASFVEELLNAYPDEMEYWIPGVDQLGNLTFNEPQGAMYRRSAAYWGDVRIIANRRGTCETWADAGLDAYCYRFNVRPTGTEPTAGVPHAVELPFVFNNPQGLGFEINPFGGQPRAYEELAFLMSATWASFMHDRDPEGWSGKYPGSAVWPKYDRADPLEIVWDANVTSLTYVEADTYRAEGIRFILDHTITYRR
jgi:carboxylesterase type B